VLLVAPQPTYEDRGTPIAVVHVLQALSELGCDTDVLTYPIGVDVPLPGVRWFRTANPLGFEHVPVGLSWRKLALDLLMLPKMASMLRKTRYDYIHAVEEAAFPAALLGRLMGIPLLYDMQSRGARIGLKAKSLSVPVGRHCSSTEPPGWYTERKRRAAAGAARDVRTGVMA
jgi:hypothetical protein